MGFLLMVIAFHLVMNDYVITGIIFSILAGFWELGYGLYRFSKTNLGKTIWSWIVKRQPNE